jgi:hypothetical protein
MVRSKRTPSRGAGCEVDDVGRQGRRGEGLAELDRRDAVELGLEFSKSNNIARYLARHNLTLIGTVCSSLDFKIGCNILTSTFLYP